MLRRYTKIMASFEKDIIFGYLLYLADRDFRDSMVHTALQYVDDNSTQEHYLVCGIVDESDAKVVKLFRSMAKSYSLYLPIRDASEGWRVVKEFELSREGYTFQDRDNTIILDERESACVELLSQLNEECYSKEVDDFINCYRNKPLDYMVFLKSIDRIALRLNRKSECSFAEQQVIRIVDFINDYSFGGIEDWQIKEVTTILELLWSSIKLKPQH